jgi:hypothetical protein
MKKITFTKAQRQVIYRQALELLSDAHYSSENSITPREYARYVCHAISQAAVIEFNTVLDNMDVKIIFPEVYMFRSDYAIECSSLWLSEHGLSRYELDPENEAGNDLRKVVLMFAIEMCS